MSELQDQNVFYKYRPITSNYSKKMLRNYFLRYELWHAKPGCLNDPFDCMPCVTFEGKADRGLSTAFFKEIHERTGVLSMSKNPVSTQQWSYYAEDHKGVCIGFNMRHVDPRERYHVAYETSRVVIPHELIVSDDESDQREVRKLMLKTVTTKAPNWSHEDEYRFLKSSEGTATFPADSLVSVYFGYKCSESDISYIQSLVRRSSAAPHFAMMIPTEDSSYDMEIHAEDDFERLRKMARERVPA